MGAGLGGVAEDLTDAGEFAFVFLHFPGLVLLEVDVAVGDVVVDGLEGEAELAVLHGGGVGGGGFYEGFAEGEVCGIGGLGGADGGVAEAFGHVDGPVEEVAEVVCEFGVEEHDEAVEIEVAVFP